MFLRAKSSAIFIACWMVWRKWLSKCELPKKSVSCGKNYEQKQSSWRICKRRERSRRLARTESSEFFPAALQPGHVLNGEPGTPRCFVLGFYASSLQIEWGTG